jgi:transposase InsO family protein
MPLNLEIRISMSRKGDPYDHAQCERVIKTMKYEGGYFNEYETQSEAGASISKFI